MVKESEGSDVVRAYLPRIILSLALPHAETAERSVIAGIAPHPLAPLAILIVALALVVPRALRALELVLFGIAEAHQLINLRVEELYLISFPRRVDYLCSHRCFHASDVHPEFDGQPVRA